jgi:hypothetical protein
MSWYGAGWRNACWLDADDKPVDLMAEFRTAVDGLIDRPMDQAQT